MRLSDYSSVLQLVRLNLSLGKTATSTFGRTLVSGKQKVLKRENHSCGILSRRLDLNEFVIKTKAITKRSHVEMSGKLKLNVTLLRLDFLCYRGLAALL